MNSTNPNSFDDKDLDDAALWAVIDAADAAATYSSTKHRGTVAVKFPNQQSPTTPVSYASPPQNTKNPHQIYRYGPPDSSAQHYDRPQKMTRSCASEVAETSPLAVVHRTPPPAASPLSVYRSPESYMSPGIGRFSPGSYGGSEVSPGSIEKQEEGILRHSLSGNFPSVELFKEYQNSAMAILEKSDYTMISGNPFIKKSGWRKISFYFNLSFEIKDKTIEFDENRNVQRAEFIVRAYMQGGRFSDGWGSCDRREKRFLKPNHDVPSTAETRAKNKACQDLLGIGEYKPGLSNVQR